MERGRNQNPNNCANATANHTKKKRVAKTTFNAHHGKSLRRAREDHAHGLKKSVEKSNRSAAFPRQPRSDNRSGGCSSRHDRRRRRGLLWRWLCTGCSRLGRKFGKLGERLPAG